MRISIKLVDSIGWGWLKAGTLGVLRVPDRHWGFWGGFRNRYEIMVVRGPWFKVLVVLLHEIGHLVIFLMPRIGRETNILMWWGQSVWDKAWSPLYGKLGFRP
jgi:hypothetical protein